MRLLLLGLWMTSSFAFSTVESWGSVDQGDQVLADAQVKESYPMADPLGLDPRWIAADESLKECLSYSHAQAIVSFGHLTIPAKSTSRIRFKIDDLPRGMVPTCGVLHHLVFLGWRLGQVDVSLEIPGWDGPQSYELEIPVPSVRTSQVLLPALGPGDDVAHGTWFVKVTNHNSTNLMLDSAKIHIFTRFD